MRFAIPVLTVALLRIRRAFADSGGRLYVPNAWNADGKGFSCIAIRDSPPSFDATWKWSSDPESVHSYPHVKFSDPALPVPLSNLSALTLSAQWAMGPGSKPRPVPSLDLPGLAYLNVSANVAFDIFADRNPDNAQQETEAETEIMIWLAKIGKSQPLGYRETESDHRTTLRVGHVDFDLYRGRNQRGTSVFTWVARSRETSFSADISLLLQYLWRNGFMSPGSHVGLVSFGTEGNHADGNVTFSSLRYDLHMLIGPAPTLDVSPIPTACSPSASPSSAAGHPEMPWLFGMISISGVFGTVLALL
ncbi:hypothetical protein VTH82DRAFT_1349 [Thermothelomyces myriococcoides]